jgi:glycerophosphoryl diester phosphodiesterase
MRSSLSARQPETSARKPETQARPDRLRFLTARPFAHRGLHGAGVSENGMAAFDAAIAQGLGIECDVRLSHDGVAIVFHDATLTRMTGRHDPVAGLTAEDLGRRTLPDGGGIPTLSALLTRCGGTTPLLVEIKVDGKAVDALCRAVANDLTRWPGAPVAVMSFNPMVGHWFARHAPYQPRGLVVTQRGKTPLRGRIERTLALWSAKPDFIACDIRDLPSPFATRARQRGLPVLSWTVRSEEQHQCAGRHADQIIFERIDD